MNATVTVDVEEGVMVVDGVCKPEGMVEVDFDELVEVAVTVLVVVEVDVNVLAVAEADANVLGVVEVPRLVVNVPVLDSPVERVEVTLDSKVVVMLLRLVPPTVLDDAPAIVLATPVVVLAEPLVNMDAVVEALAEGHGARVADVQDP